MVPKRESMSLRIIVLSLLFVSLLTVSPKAKALAENGFSGETSRQFGDLKTLGQMEKTKKIKKLEELGETQRAINLYRTGLDPVEFGLTSLFDFDDADMGTAHVFGFIKPTVASDGNIVKIDSAVSIDPDLSLKNSRIDLTLDRLRIANYPGGDDFHQILFGFSAHHSGASGTEPISFTQTYRAREGESVAVVGYPIFNGLKVGPSGAFFECSTINVKNEDDEKLLENIDSPVMKGGLSLLTTAQPAVAPLAAVAVSFIKGLAEKNKNVAVQNFFVGLDFSNVSTRPKLRIGSYVAIQVQETRENLQWNWDDWIFDKNKGRIVRKDDQNKLIPYNYLVFGVSSHEGS